MDNYSNYSDYDNYSEVDAETTNDKCPNKCGQLLVTWTEANSPDDYYRVWHCNQCEQQWTE
jgi:hypothetical protein